MRRDESEEVQVPIVVLKAVIQCPGCEDTGAAKDMRDGDFELYVEAFRSRHAKCPKQGTLPGGVR